MKPKHHYHHQPSSHSTSQEVELLRHQLRAFAKDLATEATNPSVDPKFNLEDVAEQLRKQHGLSVQALQCGAELVPEDRSREFAVLAAGVLERIADRTLKEDDQSIASLREILPDVDLMLVVTNMEGDLPAPRDFAGWAAVLKRRGTSLKVNLVVCSEASRKDHILLSRSQREALARLQCNWAIKCKGALVAGTDARPIPLIVGPSGSGKTAIVKHFAATLSLPVLKLSSGNWSPSGSRVTPCTHETIRDFVAQHPRGVVFIDEVDKFEGQQDYYRSVQIEVFAILDGNLDGFAGWTDEERERFRDKFLIVGAGTWQNLFRTKRKTVGFGVQVDGDSTESDAPPIDLSSQTVIPEELLNRFNARVIFLDPPNAADFRERFLEIHRGLKLMPPSPARLERLVNRAVESGKHNRAVEAYLNYLFERELGDQDRKNDPDGPKEDGSGIVA